VIFKLYVEGGGEGPRLDAQFRQAWQQFFGRAGLIGRMPKVVRGGGRLQTFDMFKTAVANPRGGEIPLLLVDSEAPVAKGDSVWEHLKARDEWQRPAGADDDQAFLMVQVMETWFLADRAMLKTYFLAPFRENALKEWPRLEAVSKATVYEALDKATAACAKQYRKGKISFELLAMLEPSLVEQACPHARALLDRLRG
jgi:hypothetical protein